MTHRALVAAINWNGMEVIPGMLDSLAPQVTETSCRMIVFDNDSHDGSAEYVEKYAAGTNNISLVRNGANAGFGAAADIIIGSVVEPFVVLVNTDTVFRPGALECLLASIESKPDVGHRRPQAALARRPPSALSEGLPFPGKLLAERIPLLRRSSAICSRHDRGTYADWLVGAVMVVRVEAFKESGGFSRDFGFFHEETDLMFRMARLGWKVWFEPSAEVVHFCGKTSRRVYEGSIQVRYIPAKLLFLRKYGGFLSVPAFRVLMSGLLAIRLLGKKLTPGERGGDDGPRSIRRAFSALWREPRPGEGFPGVASKASPAWRSP